MTPRARVTVVTMGRPSGIAATARLTFIEIKQIRHVSDKHLLGIALVQS